MVAAEALEHRSDRERPAFDRDDAGVEARNVEKRGEKVVDRRGRGLDLLDDPAALRRHRDAAQRAHEQAERMDRLAQIVARRGEEGRFGDVRRLGDLPFPLGDVLLLLQIERHLLRADC